MDVSKNNGTPKSSILIGFFIINHPFWGTPIFGNTHMLNMFGDFDVQEAITCNITKHYTFQLSCEGSVLSGRLTFCQAAIKNKHNTVHLLQRDVQVNHNAGIFITLNPATKGYGGRQKLPDNLKQLFRPVVLSVGGIHR